MGLQDDLKQLREKHTFPRKACRVGFVLDRLSIEDADQLRELLDEGLVPATLISEVLQRHGYDVPYQSVSRHRRGKAGRGCSCP